MGNTLRCSWEDGLGTSPIGEQCGECSPEFAKRCPALSRDKQIGEMTIALTEAQHEFDKAWHECLHNKGKQPERENVFYAKYLIEKKRYRKASEIFGEIEEALERAKEIADIRIKDLAPHTYKVMREVGKLYHKQYSDAIAELKKKYTEEGK